MKFNELVNYIRNTVKVADDQTAARAMDFYEEWNPAGHYEVGDRVRYLRSNGQMKLHKCRSEHDALPNYTPEVESLWEVIDVEHDGTVLDPIPYDPNMVVYKDKYYTWEDMLYLCVRDSGNPLYNTPDNLIDAGYFSLVGEFI